MPILERLAKMLGVRDDQVEDALANEQRAKQAIMLSRRGFFAAGLTMAAVPLVPNKAYSFLFEEAMFVGSPLSYAWNLNIGGIAIYAMARMYRGGIVDG